MIKIVQANQAFQVLKNGFAADIPTSCTMSLSTDGTNFSDYGETIEAGHLQVVNIMTDTFVKFSAGSDIKVLV